VIRPEGPISGLARPADLGEVEVHCPMANCALAPPGGTADYKCDFDMGMMKYACSPAPPKGPIPAMFVYSTTTALNHKFQLDGRGNPAELGIGANWPFLLGQPNIDQFLVSAEIYPDMATLMLLENGIQVGPAPNMNYVFYWKAYNNFDDSPQGFDVQLSILVFDPVGAPVQITCTNADMLGQLTIPGGLLDELKSMLRISGTFPIGSMVLEKVFSRRLDIPSDTVIAKKLPFVSLRVHQSYLSSITF
jgi:hypothetical protein